MGGGGGGCGGGCGGGWWGLYTFFSGTRTFSDYANKILLPFIEAHLKTANRLEVVWDRYFPNSLRNTTREKRGSAVRAVFFSDSGADS